MRDVHWGGVGNFLPQFFIKIVGLAEAAAESDQWLKLGLEVRRVKTALTRP